MKNSFHSNNFICLINATSQALTISNAPPQLPVSITFPAVPKGASKKPNRKDLYGNNEIYRMPVERGALSTKFRFLLICISVC